MCRKRCRPGGWDINLVMDVFLFDRDHAIDRARQLRSRFQVDGAECVARARRKRTHRGVRIASPNRRRRYPQRLRPVRRDALWLGQERKASFKVFVGTCVSGPPPSVVVTHGPLLRDRVRELNSMMPTSISGWCAGGQRAVEMIGRWGCCGGSRLQDARPAASGFSLRKIEVPGRAGGISNPVVCIAAPDVRLYRDEQVCEPGRI